MTSFLLHAIPSLFRSALPVLLRLVVLIFVFRVARFLIRQWKGLGKR